MKNEELKMKIIAGIQNAGIQNSEIRGQRSEVRGQNIIMHPEPKT
jgi:hypothetical protein